MSVSSVSGHRFYAIYTDASGMKKTTSNFCVAGDRDNISDARNKFENRQTDFVKESIEIVYLGYGKKSIVDFFV